MVAIAIQRMGRRYLVLYFLKIEQVKWNRREAPTEPPKMGFNIEHHTTP